MVGVCVRLVFFVEWWYEVPDGDLEAEVRRRLAEDRYQGLRAGTCSAVLKGKAIMSPRDVPSPCGSPTRGTLSASGPVSCRARI